MSGSSARALSTASSPDDASPTTSIHAIDSSNALRPARTTLWSSAKSTLTMGLCSGPLKEEPAERREEGTLDIGILLLPRSFGLAAKEMRSSDVTQQRSAIARAPHRVQSPHSCRGFPALGEGLLPRGRGVRSRMKPSCSSAVWYVPSALAVSSIPAAQARRSLFGRR